jgi:hypothetical protein
MVRRLRLHVPAPLAPRIRRLLTGRSVIVVSASPPFAPSAERDHAAALAAELGAEHVHLPVSGDPADAEDQRAAIAALSLHDACSELVCVGEVAALVEHPRKRVVG